MGSCARRRGCALLSAAAPSAVGKAPPCELSSPSAELSPPCTAACSSPAGAWRIAAAAAASAPMPAARSTALRFRRVHRSAGCSVDVERNRDVYAHQ